VPTMGLATGRTPLAPAGSPPMTLAAQTRHVPSVRILRIFIFPPLLTGRSYLMQTHIAHAVRQRIAASRPARGAVRPMEARRQTRCEKHLSLGSAGVPLMQAFTGVRAAILTPRPRECAEVIFGSLCRDAGY
jgi:hypothetical protein